jgi:hypothetical protein
VPIQYYCYFMLQAGRTLYFLTILGLAVTGYTETFGHLIAEPLSQEICSRLPQSGVDKKLVPHGALWKKATILHASAPEGYNAAVAWINVATVFPCRDIQDPALIEIRSIKIIEQKTAAEEVIFEKIFETDEHQGWDGALFKRQPYWFGPGEGKIGGVGIFTTGGLVVNARQIPQNIYHGWTNPRVLVNREVQQVVEMEVRITGSARMQIGMDYWRDLDSDYNGYDPNCQASNNCEAWIGDWYGDTHGEFVTIRSPQAVQ